jgi:hypothetical protein
MKVHLKEWTMKLFLAVAPKTKKLSSNKEQSKYAAQSNPSLCHAIVSLAKISDVEQDV